ncbi:YheC/YheD family protein [Paenibacillus humicola]|uniref:YheC/YheD family protein n=1 Tax=Paenibacillus humicola TaxID=3110540 RepID=UPI00237B1796|nr:YheC/YheD family protein [Paenibacillus humicola]
MGKWKLHQFYSRDEGLRGLLPSTSLYSPAALKRYLNRYRAVYIKPDMEHTGKGIVKAWRTGEGYAFIKVRGRRSASVPGTEALHKQMGLGGKRGAYVIQRAIELASVKGRAFDVRVMMMRYRGKWTYAGMIAKVAGPGSIVTNVRRGRGYTMTVPGALRVSGRFDGGEIERFTGRLVAVSRKVCARFDRYKFSRQIGIDYGIDKNGRLWIIEVNFDYPSHALFLGLKDKTFYRKIKRIQASWKKRTKSEPRPAEAVSNLGLSGPAVPAERKK